jgi:hypothetical protein
MGRMTVQWFDWEDTVVGKTFRSFGDVVVMWTFRENLERPKRG